MNTKILIIITLACFLSLTPAGLISRGYTKTAVTHSLYANLLRKYVHQGEVDYRGFKSEEAFLDQYLKILEKVDPKSLPRNEQFAFYINAYNAWTIKLILGSYPGIKTIKDLGSFLKGPWKKKIARINGDVITLDDIEHNILRPRFKDPRVHFAINCAALSCPPLGSTPYIGSRLDSQLDNSVRAFINNSERNYIKGNTLYVSKIFKWFSRDFNDDIISFFLKHGDADLKKKLGAKKGNIEIKYLHYDWSLNGK